MIDHPESASHAVPLPPKAGPCAIAIFGASGDLTSRKLIPALYNLAADKLLPDGFAVVGMATRELTTDVFRDRMKSSVQDHVGTRFDEKIWDWLSKRLYFVSGDFRNPEAYTKLKDALQAAETEHGTGGNILHYLSTPPSFFAEIVQHLGEVGLTQETDHMFRRVVIEKPFGHDLDSAKKLNRDLSGVLKEEQVYRIDHYLGKETVQNILVFRFANAIFEPIWNRRYVDHVQFTVSEELGVEHRGKYYEEAGALRDMVPNHMIQLLALVAMEPPTSFGSDAVRNEKIKLLTAIQAPNLEDVVKRAVRGQYGPGVMPDGEIVPAYRSEALVSPESRTETFVALKLMIDNWRWADVPFYLRTGKRLPKRTTEICMQFKRVPFSPFRHSPVDRLEPNQLVLRLQPNEGISLRFGAKVPGPSLQIGAVDMDFSYSDYFGASLATGYETLLYDAMKGDATLFQRADSVSQGWSVVEPILDFWKALPPRSFPNYHAGSWGPDEADQLLMRDGRKWRNNL